MVISWYPGHMVKARRQISDSLKLVDAVCEIVDARIPYSSRNPDLDGLTGDKPRLIVLNRTDQADPLYNKMWAAHFRDTGAVVMETDSKSGNGVEKLSNAVNKLLAGKIAMLAEKGQAGKRLRLIVVGIPNVGKSSFINRAAKRKAAQTSDRPGVTRGQQWIKLAENIELLDTPGVLWPKQNDRTVAENLAFTGAIRDEVIDMETLGIRLMLRLVRHYPDSITGRYKIDTDEVKNCNNSCLIDDVCDDEIGYKLLSKAAKARGFLLSGGEYDTLRMAAILLDEFRGGKLGRITLEQPG